MSYTREQRAANAAKAAEAAAKAAEANPEPQPQQEVEQVVEQQRLDKPSDRLKPRNPRREGIINEILAEQGKNVEPSAPADTPAETPAAEPAPVSQDVSQPAEPAAEPAVVMTKQVVDGREYEVAQSEIEESGGERAWRKDKAAQNRLDEAKAALAESKRTQAAIAAWAQSQVHQQPAQPQYTPEQYVNAAKEAFKTGDFEKGSEWMAEAFRLQSARYNPAEEQNVTMFKIAQQNAAARFREEFKDIASNPVLMKFAATLENEELPKKLQELGIQGKSDPRLPHFDFSTLYRNIGNQIRGSFARPSQPASPAQDSTTSTPSQPPDREARKASAVVSLPSASVRAELPEADKPDSRDEILAKAMKARGKKFIG